MAFTRSEAFELLQKADQQNRLAHAYLVTGPEGSGKRELVTELSAIITGAKGDAFKHPDVHVAEPESISRRIVIEQIRELEKELQMRSTMGGRKVGIIFDADRLVESAANAFLKTLEEPPRHSHLILVSSEPERMLETILSRCIEVTLRPTQTRQATPRQTELLQALSRFTRQDRPDLAKTFLFVREFQALLASAKQSARDEGEAAFKAEKDLYKQTTGTTGAWLEEREEFYAARSEARYRRERAALLGTLEQWWGDVLRLQNGSSRVDFPDFQGETLAQANRLSLPQILQRATAMGQLREHLEFNVQEQLAIEVAFIEAFAA